MLPHGALRLVDVLNLLVLAPAGMLVLHALLEHVLDGEIVGYQDDELSHLLFFAGIAAVLLAIVANPSFEEIGLDLFVVAAVAALALTLWLRRGPRPLILYFGSSYTAGLLLTAVLTMQ